MDFQRTTCSREQILEALRSIKPLLQKQYQVNRIGIFGSIARNQENSESDIDVVVEMNDPDLFSLVHIKELLENSFGKRVDIILYKDRMNPFLKSRVQSEAIYV